MRYEIKRGNTVYRVVENRFGTSISIFEGGTLIRVIYLRVTEVFLPVAK